MKEGTPKNARTAPAHRPIAVATVSTITVAIGKGNPQLTATTPNSAEVKATADPTLMSISPAMMTSVMPQSDDPGEGHLTQDVEDVRDGGKMGRKN